MKIYVGNISTFTPTQLLKFCKGTLWRKRFKLNPTASWNTNVEFLRTLSIKTWRRKICWASLTQKSVDRVPKMFKSIIKDLLILPINSFL